MRIKRRDSDGNWVETDLYRFDLYLNWLYDSDIIDYLESLPPRSRGVAIRELVRRGMGNQPNGIAPAPTPPRPTPPPMPDTTSDVDWMDDIQSFGFPTTED